MSEQDGTPRAAPPTMPGVLTRPDAVAAWPGVVGTFCIVFGVLGTLGSSISLVWHALFATGVLDNLFAWIASQGSQVNPALVMQNHTVIILVSEVLKLALAVMLLVVGIGLLHRRPPSVRLAKIWSVAKIVFTLIGTAIGLWMQRQMLQSVLDGANAPSNAPPTMPFFMTSGAVLGGVLAISWSCALPVFMLIWLNLRFVKKEISNWGSPIA